MFKVTVRRAKWRLNAECYLHNIRKVILCAKSWTDEKDLEQGMNNTLALFSVSVCRGAPDDGT